MSRGLVGSRITYLLCGHAKQKLWPVVTGLIFTPIVYEFQPTHAPELTLGQNCATVPGRTNGSGLACGSFWMGIGK